jgi:SET domain-containing protein
MKRIAVRRSGVHGRGVFALRALSAGELILEYAGTVMSWKQAITRHHRFGKEGHTFFFGLSDGRVIDGSLGGNSTRWLNHACVANCEAVECDGRVHIYAVSEIQPGEELFITYGLSVEGRLSARVRAQYWCRCGHRRCRGTMLAPTRRST